MKHRVQKVAALAVGLILLGIICIVTIKHFNKEKSSAEKTKKASAQDGIPRQGGASVENSSVPWYEDIDRTDENSWRKKYEQWREKVDMLFSPLLEKLNSMGQETPYTPITRQEFENMLKAMNIRIMKNPVSIDKKTCLKDFGLDDKDKPLFFINEASPKVLPSLNPTEKTLNLGLSKYAEAHGGLTKDKKGWKNSQNFGFRNIVDTSWLSYGDGMFSECNDNVYIVHGIGYSAAQIKTYTKIRNHQDIYKRMSKLFSNILEYTWEKGVGSIICTLISTGDLASDGEFANGTKFTKDEYIDCAVLGMFDALSDFFSHIDNFVPPKIVMNSEFPRE